MRNSRNISWQRTVAKYQHPQRWRSAWQLANTLIPYAVLWYVMFQSLKISYWLTLALSVIAAGFLVRVFIIFHDCGHGSFFKSRKANQFWGFLTGVLMFTPYYNWWHKHALHHASAGDLDNRGVGDMWTMTVQEYRASSGWTRMCYRLARNPFCMLLVGSPVFFLIINRVPHRFSGQRGIVSIHLTNLGILCMAVLISYCIGFKAYLLIQFPIVFISSVVGTWLFYVQHQFEGVYWERHSTWDYIDEAIHGSSFYKLPKILQWFTGNIGFHHIHHLSPRIPNYYLERCHNEILLFKDIKPLTFLSSLKSSTLALWDEESRQLVGFDHIRGR